MDDSYSEILKKLELIEKRLENIEEKISNSSNLSEETLFYKALEAVANLEQISEPILQKALGISFDRASSLFNKMEEMQLVIVIKHEQENESDPINTGVVNKTRIKELLRSRKNN